MRPSNPTLVWLSLQAARWPLSLAEGSVGSACASVWPVGLMVAEKSCKRKYGLPKQRSRAWFKRRGRSTLCSRSLVYSLPPPALVWFILGTELLWMPCLLQNLCPRSFYWYALRNFSLLVHLPRTPLFSILRVLQDLVSYFDCRFSLRKGNYFQIVYLLIKNFLVFCKRVQILSLFCLSYSVLLNNFPQLK